MMDLSHKKKRKEARRLFLTGELGTNAEIARKLGLKPHTVAKYRKEEDWDGLRMKVDRRAAEKMIDQLANERVSLNMRHYKYFEVILNEVAATLKASTGKFSTRELSEVISIVEKAQKGQRLARGLSLSGETEEQIRAQAEADNRTMVDAFVDAVKEHVVDEDVQERIYDAVMTRFPETRGEVEVNDPEAA